MSLLPQHRSLEEQVNIFLQKWNLNHWKFEWEPSRKFLGRCYFAKRLITLSKYYCLFLPEEENKDTILHEIAHALTWEQYLIDQNTVHHNLWSNMRKAYLGHNLVWELFCKQVGAKPQKCYNGEIQLPKLK